MSLWRDNYKIGVSQLDQQHKLLITTTEDLLKALNKNDRKYYKQAMDFLKDYVVVHFSAEEMYMEKVGYKGLAKHKKLHAEFAEELHQQELTLIRSHYAKADARELADMLTRWLIYHIMREDKKIPVPKDAEAADTPKAP